MLMACVTQLEQVLDNGYLGVRIGSELEVDASCGKDGSELSRVQNRIWRFYDDDSAEGYSGRTR
jgi:hypothetical protein